MRWLVFLFFVHFFELPHAFGQQVYRITGKFSIKVKQGETGNLTMGQFYFDAGTNSILYKVRFPAQEMWLLRGQKMHRIIGDSIITRDSIMGAVDFSLFNLTVNNQLGNYGLKDSPFKITEVRKEGDLVVSTWSPPEQLSKLMGKVLISQKNRRLHAVVFLNPKGEVVRKQFFSTYQKIGNLFFPTEIIDLFYLDGEIITHQMTTYSDIQLNATDEAHLYNFDLAGVGKP
jgi:hypothetical protein